MGLEAKLGFLGSLVVKDLPDNASVAGDLAPILGSGRSPGAGNGNPLQYFCLENPMDKGAWQSMGHRVTKSLDTTEATDSEFCCFSK